MLEVQTYKYITQYVIAVKPRIGWIYDVGISCY